MQDKKLLYGVLAATALAASVGVYRSQTDEGGQPIVIAPVPTSDSPSSVAAAEVPVRLTASDGTGLRLASLRASAAVEDPLALTELHLTFENPEDRVLEGTFRITLPEGASISRLAMNIEDAWQEGEVVEKQEARRVYESFLHRRQDPLLLEQAGGNELSARVFPIPARGKKEIIVTYSEALELGAPYVLPLRGLSELGSVDIDVHVAPSRAGSARSAYSLHQRDFTPADDFVVPGKQLARSPGLRSDELAIARVVPFASSRAEPVESAVVLVDTSASRGLGIAEQTRTLRAIVQKLPPGARLTVACFDQEVVPVFEGNASELGEREASEIIARGALGASDFEQAIAWAGERAKSRNASRIIWLTDGVATAGEIDAQKLRRKVETLREVGVKRMDAIAIGGIRDDAFLRTVVRGVLDRDGVVLDAKLGAEAIARRLGEATSSGVPVKVEGARWSWPVTLDGLQAGDEVLVFAEVDAGAPVRIDVGGQQFTPDLRTAERPLVERAWAQAKIQSLVEAPEDSPARTKERIIALSTRHRVLSPHTALLVLETDWDYRRFGIDRTATLDILSVRDGRVAVTQSERQWESRAKEIVRLGQGRPTVPPVMGVPAPSGAGGVADSVASPAPAPAPAELPSRAGEAFTTTHDRAAAAPPAMEAPAPSAFHDTGAAGQLPATGGGGHIARGFGEAPAEGAARPAAAPRLMLPRALGDDAPAPRARPAPRAAPAPATPARPLRTGPPRPRQEERAPVAKSRCTPGDPLCTDLRPGAAPPTWCTPGDPLCTVLGPDAAPPPALAEGYASVRPLSLTADGGVAADAVQPIMRAAVPALRACYARELQRSPTTSGRVTLRVSLASDGRVAAVDVLESPGTDELRRCVGSVARPLRFPAPGEEGGQFTQSFALVGGDTPPSVEERPSVPDARPYEGRFKVVMDALDRGDQGAALAEARRWQGEQPGDVLALVALGEAFEASGDLGSAARAYGSILELYPFRADSRRFAGERLDRLEDARARALAVDTYEKAVEQRPDHPSSHRLYAIALLKNGEYDKAFEAMQKGAARSYPPGRFAGVQRILREDLGLIAAAWKRAEPHRAAEIRTKLLAAGGQEERDPSLRFVLVWETDANDVDFHIYDAKGGHAYYGQRQLESGGELYADVTTGYGPECFTIRGPREARAYPYTLQAHYYSRGPMGYGMGKVQIIDHDGRGNLTFEERPFVVMADRAYVDIGKVEREPSKASAMK